MVEVLCEVFVAGSESSDSKDFNWFPKVLVRVCCMYNPSNYYLKIFVLDAQNNSNALGAMDVFALRS